MNPADRFAEIDLIFPLAAGGTVVVAVVVLWANARRPLNVMAAATLVFGAVYMTMFYLVVHPPFHQSARSWLRAYFALSVWSLELAWMMKRASTHPATFYRDIIPRSGLLILVVAALSCWCMTENIVPTLVPLGESVNGPGFFPFNVVMAAVAAGILAQTLLELRDIRGIQRMELKILVIGATLTIFSATTLGVLGRIYHNQWLIRSAPMCAPMMVGVMIWGVTQRRILDGRQMLLTILWYGGLLSVSIVGLVAATRISGVPVAASVAASGAVCFAIAIGGQRWLQAKLYDRPREKDVIARREMLALTQLLEPDLVIQRAQAILRAWAPAERVQIMEVPGSAQSRAPFIAAVSPEILSALVEQSGWATPASLQRRRGTRETRILAEFLETQSVGLIAASSAPFGETPVVVGISERRSRKPFTYADARGLSDCCEILGVALSRANLSVKVRQSERLAISGMINAGFVHEIRSALNTIKAFSEVVEGGLATPEELKSLAGTSSEQVARAERMIAQILMFVHPKNLRRGLIDANDTARRSAAAVVHSAAKAGASLVMNLSPEPQMVLADNALDHCVINLLENAIDSVGQSGKADRTVTVTTRRGSNDIELIVSDNGPGISPLIRDRLFQPFATGKPGGTGLGLMFSKMIVESQNGTLTVEAAGPPGAAFAVRLPIPKTPTKVAV